ncbi:MAG TPA: hypothetical protein VE913_00040 [Longimicrobium sp.]|nr:hypothetical protein [Longimicrobium sp.]
MLLRIVLIAAASLFASSAAGAQKSRPSAGGAEQMMMTAKVADAPPRVYRAALDTLAKMGYTFRALIMDEAILTQPRAMPELAMLGASEMAVQVEFTAVGDSTEIRVRGAVGQGGASSPVTLVGAMQAMAGIVEAHKKIPPARRTVADSLAAAGAYGYSRANPIRVGGGLDNGAASERAFLATLRGPGGETVEYLRLGSCCAYPVATAPGGRAVLDVYEVRYAGQADPAVLYLSMYELAAPRAPEGFVQRAAATTETTRR